MPGLIGIITARVIVNALMATTKARASEYYKSRLAR